MMTLRPLKPRIFQSRFIFIFTRKKKKRKRKEKNRRNVGLTLWTEGNADSIGKDIDTPEDASTTIIAELNILMCTASKRRPGFGGSATEGTGGRVHSYFNNNEQGREAGKDGQGRREVFAKKTRNKNVRIWEKSRTAAAFTC